MTKFLFAFHGGKMPDSPDAIQEIMTKWGSWMEELDLVDPGSILAHNQHVGSVQTDTDDLSGYLIAKHISMDAAVADANNCPILANGGSIEIAQLIDMDH